MNYDEMNTLDYVVKKMEEKPYLLRMGAKKIANRLHVPEQTVRDAKIAYRQSNIERRCNVPNILMLDLEVSPMVAYTWGRFDQNISLDQTISESFIISYSAKWLYDNVKYNNVLTPEEVKNRDDYRLVATLHHLINKADIVCAYNANRADIPWFKSRCIIHKLPPIKPLFIVDPYRIVKNVFGFSSNKLDAIAGYFNIDHKIKTDFNLWKRCMEGDPEALSLMGEYNSKDTDILEEIYIKLRPWIRNHPNVSNIFEEDICPTCGYDKYEIIHGEYYYTGVNKYQLYRCLDCGTIFRDRQPIKSNKVLNVACSR